MKVIADRDELIQVFQNLIENACKYGNDGDRVTIKGRDIDPPLGVEAQKVGWYEIEVRDYGVGISEDHLPRITERFYRVDPEDSKKKMGTGLGLAVVKHILTRHHAQLKMASEPESGASFRVLMASAPF